MYKLLLVDDERLILEGISQVVEWEQAGTELAGTARNGIEALEKIEALAPDIVITDISMPGLDELGLVERCSRKYPAIKFIMLTGYKDFDYACTAMQHGVKHYLLKPCNEQQIHEALTELVKELEEQKSREQFITGMKDRLTKVLPHVKEQFLKEWISNKTYGTHDLDYFQELFGTRLDDKSVRLILFYLEGNFEYEHLFALQNISKEILSEVLLSTTTGSHVLILLEQPEDGGQQADLLERIAEVKEIFLNFYKIHVTIAVSDQGRMIHSHSLYRQTLQCLNHRFYLEEGSLITGSDIQADELRGKNEIDLEEEQICLLIKAGDQNAVEAELDVLFGVLSEQRFDINVTRSYVLQLYSAMIRLCIPEERSSFTSGLAELAELYGFGGNAQYFSQVFKKVTGRTPTDFMKPQVNEPDY